MSIRTNLRIWLIVLISTFGAWWATAEAKIIYVDANPILGGDGTSWPTAFKYLQDALDVAVSGDQIWVAAGTYYPTSDYGLAIGNRGRHFQLINGVAIYGGFPDTGDPDMSDRDPNQYETILSGNIGDDDSDNSYHVFYHPAGTYFDPNAILDGFTITAGNADGSYPHNHGGGMNNRYSSPTVIGCTFTGNSANHGGGMNNWYSSPTVIGCTFTGNSADYYGGGMHNSSSDPWVSNCTFSGNSADGGGGMFNLGNSPTVTDCTFTGNSAEYYGGGMFNASSNPTVNNCTFSGNSANYEGGGMCNFYSSPIVSNCTFIGNSADYLGGGMFNFYSSPIVSNSILWGNTTSNGNEIYNYDDNNRTSIPVISYCDIADCGGSGGGWDGSLGSDSGGNIDADPLFADPSGSDGDPATWEDNDYHLLPTSPCIDAGDPDDDWTNEPPPNGGRINMGAYGNTPEATTTIDTDGDGINDPQETRWGLNPNDTDTDDDGLTDGFEVCYDYDCNDYDPYPGGGDLDAYSSDTDGDGMQDDWEVDYGDCVDPLADNDADLDCDNDGYTNLQEFLRDTEPNNENSFPVPITFYVDNDAPDDPDPNNPDISDPNEDGSSEHPFDEIQEAVDYAIGGDTIIVLEGTYWENLNVNNKDIKITCTEPSDPNVVSATIIDGQLLGSVVTIVDANTIIDGFTITNGYGNGGGINCNSAGPTIANCVITGNLSGDDGGGVMCSGGNPLFINCSISNNSTYDEGAGIYCGGGAPVFENCEITSNFGVGICRGGGMWCSGSSPTIIGCNISGNSSINGSGGLGLFFSTNATIINSIIASNTSNYSCGGIKCYDQSDTIISNCIVSRNNPDGIFAMRSVECLTTNSIVHDNSGTDLSVSSYYGYGPSILTVLYSNVSNGETGVYVEDGSTPNWGEGNIDTDPCFVDSGYWNPNNTPADPNDDFWVDGDYHLLPNSPCIDAGDSGYIPWPNDVDKDGNPRVVDGDNDGIARIDMGPYEFQKYCGGTGTAEDPYLICDPNHMQQIGANPDDWDKYFKLMADIDLSAYTGKQFNIIGWYEGGDENEPFTGIFDGNGHTISNFTHESAAANYVGIFGYIAGETAEIKDLGLIDPNINSTAGISIGALAGCIGDGTTVSDCYVKGGTVTGKEMVGALAGRTGAAAVSRCSAACDVTGDRLGIGGLIGDAWQTIISECYATGSVTADNSGVGGLVGHQYGGQILTSYTTSAVTAIDSGVGGLVGNGEWASIMHCYAAGSVYGVDEVGGLAGCYSDGEIIASFWDTLTTDQTEGIGYDEVNGTVELYGRTTAQMRQRATFTDYGWDFAGESANGTEDVWTIWEGAYYPRLAWENAITGDFTIDDKWMYQNLPGATTSTLTTTVSVTNDPMANNSYTYRWEFALPDDVIVAPAIIDGCGDANSFCTFAAPGCDEPNGLSDSGQPLTVRVTVTGADFGNTGIAEAQFGIALLGDVNNDCVVNVADRAIVNAFWRLGEAGPFTFRDCDLNCDGAVNVADRSITNAIWRNVLCRNSVGKWCPLR